MKEHEIGYKRCVFMMEAGIERELTLAEKEWVRTAYYLGATDAMNHRGSKFVDASVELFLGGDRDRIYYLEINPTKEI